MSFLKVPFPWRGGPGIWTWLLVLALLVLEGASVQAMPMTKDLANRLVGYAERDSNRVVIKLADVAGAYSSNGRVVVDDANWRNEAEALNKELERLGVRVESVFDGRDIEKLPVTVRRSFRGLVSGLLPTSSFPARTELAGSE